MRVKVIDYDDNDEILRCVCDLQDCFPDDDEGYHLARNEIDRSGRCWVGGGAAPLVLLMPEGERT